MAKGSTDPNNRRVTRAAVEKTLANTKRKAVQWDRNVKPPAETNTPDEDEEDELFTAIENSQDKLLFIKFRPKGASSYTWAVVQVDMEETDERKAKSRGVYRCRWFGPHPEDIKHKSIRDS